MKNITKRDGRRVPFDKMKIVDAVLAAFKEVDGGELSDYAYAKAGNIADYIAEIADSKELTIEEVQDLVEKGLMSTKRKDVARAYIAYRDLRNRVRGNTIDKQIKEIIEGQNEYWNTENSNKNPQIASTQRDYIAGQVSTDLSRRELLPTDVVAAHDEGIIHFHDMDYFAQHIFNCCLVNLEDMLQNGTVINGTMIEKPHSFSTACTIATQIIAVIASGQYGGQSVSLAHLAPFVDISRQNIKKKLKDELKDLKLDDESIDRIVESRLKEEIRSGVQTIQYQINTLNTSNGQTPFVTVFMYLNEAKNEKEKYDLSLIIEEVLKQRHQGTKNEVGVWVTPAFPKLIYVLEEDNIHEDSKYFYLTELAAKCTAKRLVPDYISEKIMKELKEGYCFPVMGCRSALSPWYDANGNAKFYGRFNQGVVTLNLVDVALTAVTEDKDFWKLLDERTELCHKALRCRHERLKGTLTNISPLHWQYGGLARLGKDETIDSLLYGGYSSISLGYAGLWECVYALSGSKLTEPEGQKLGLEIMEFLNSKCTKWKEEENIGYGIYGTPLESTTYKFAKCLKKRFGEIPEVTDHNYITNSYHINVREPISAFEKLEIEAKFQALSTGGAISYIETPDIQNNIPAVLQIIKFIYDNIMYAELNTKSDYCQVCGYDGEMEIKEDMTWRCPNCGNEDHNKLNIARRTCGYIGSNFWNYGRTEEIKDRVVHLDE